MTTILRINFRANLEVFTSKQENIYDLYLKKKKKTTNCFSGVDSTQQTDIAGITEYNGISAPSFR